MVDSKSLFEDFNHSKFVVFVCLLPSSILLSLHLDGHITWSLWLVLFPLWLLKLIVILGAIIGCIQWCRYPESRNEADGYTDFKAMLMTLGMHLLLLMFELLVCNKIENHGNTSWIFVFMPLYFVSPVAVAACIWGFRHERSLELETVLSVNILLFIFVALKLDGTINWSWSVIFIPLWIVMCLPGIAVLYYLIWTLLFFRTTYPEVDRRSHLSDAIMWIVVVIPLLTFEILVAYRLNGNNNLPWVNIFVPLYLSLTALIWSSFGRKGGNKWWFGLREDFCLYLLHLCPFMQIYGNVVYKMPRDANNAQDEFSTDTDSNNRSLGSNFYTLRETPTKIIMASPGRYDSGFPVVHIASPD